jgi:hypothetical protein
LFDIPGRVGDQLEARGDQESGNDHENGGHNQGGTVGFGVKKKLFGLGGGRFLPGQGETNRILKWMTHEAAPRFISPSYFTMKPMKKPGAATPLANAFALVSWQHYYPSHHFISQSRQGQKQVKR